MTHRKRRGSRKHIDARLLEETLTEITRKVSHLSGRLLDDSLSVAEQNATDSRLWALGRVSEILKNCVEAANQADGTEYMRARRKQQEDRQDQRVKSLKAEIARLQAKINSKMAPTTSSPIVISAGSTRFNGVDWKWQQLSDGSKEYWCASCRKYHPEAAYNPTKYDPWDRAKNKS